MRTTTPRNGLEYGPVHGISKKVNFVDFSDFQSLRYLNINPNYLRNAGKCWKPGRIISFSTCDPNQILNDQVLFT